MGAFVLILIVACVRHERGDQRGSDWRGRPASRSGPRTTRARTIQNLQDRPANDAQFRRVIIRRELKVLAETLDLSVGRLHEALNKESSEADGRLGVDRVG